jgi:YD repeat-containing protein
MQPRSSAARALSVQATELAAATTVQFLYDANGNTTRRDDQNGTELYCAALHTVPGPVRRLEHYNPCKAHP